MSVLKFWGTSHRPCRTARYRLWHKPSEARPRQHQSQHHRWQVATSATGIAFSHPLVTRLQHSERLSPQHWALHSTVGTTKKFFTDPSFCFTPSRIKTRSCNWLCWGHIEAEGKGISTLFSASMCGNVSASCPPLDTHTPEYEFWSPPKSNIH